MHIVVVVVCLGVTHSKKIWGKIINYSSHENIKITHLCLFNDNEKYLSPNNDLKLLIKNLKRSNKIFFKRIFQLL